MLKSHERFHSTNGKRRILVAEDEIINRFMLGEMLKDEYDILYAENGKEALDTLHENKDILSLMLLDIMMPVMSGLEVLQAVKDDDDLSKIPIIVMTSEKETEVESLDLGAIDFIPKPYPQPGVVRARIRRTIELSEDRDIIQSTERDILTGLYNKEYFYRYARQFDSYHKDMVMDAVIADINHFHMINDRYGKAYGDAVLKKLGIMLRDTVQDSGGIVCRREADTFMIYCPHREDYDDIIEKTAAAFQDEDSSGNRVRLRMGIYPDIDKSLDVAQIFDRAKMAADTVKGTFAKNIAYYDKALHEQQLYAEQLIEDFPAAIEEKQFKVFYQPKFNIQEDTPVLVSAEALVRWIHPKLGMISPGVFIPLFEDNGLIQKLDSYVWKETAAQIRRWKEDLHYAVPVSVNVSRVDMFDSSLSDTLLSILNQEGLTSSDILLEVTESAYTRDSEQIIRTVENLRKLGFRIEMDDFGTGYSSLHMLSELPIDVLKIDMKFVRHAFSEGGNTHMVEVIIGIADYLSVPVIAEGVETEEQLHSLKLLGCDIVQGYFFSKPVPAEEYEAFILQKKEADLSKQMKSDKKTSSEESEQTDEKDSKQSPVWNIVHENMTADEKGEDEKMEDQEYQVAKEQTGIHLRTATLFFAVLATIAAIALLIADFSVSQGYRRMETASDRYVEAQLATSDMESGSDYLTDRVRCFVVTGEMQYFNDFIEEIKVTKRRDKAVENLENLLEGEDKSALENLNTALELSNELVNVENMAMRLMFEAEGVSEDEIPPELKGIQISEQDKKLSAPEMKKKAQTLVFDNEYMHYKEKIRENVGMCTQALIRSSSQELEKASGKLSILVQIQTIMTIVFMLVVLGVVYIITRLIREPLTTMVKKMQDQEIITPTGVEELRFVARIYNKILKENRESHERLSHEASHDALTGLFNRGAYDLWMKSADTEHIALILLDVDYFKTVNDTYGHDIGDRVLKRVADILRKSFRSVDVICRIGGDEFAVVMTRVNSTLSQLVADKITYINGILQHPKDDLPPVSLSVGVAFSDRKNPEGDIFKDADTALYRVKEAGRKGYCIF